MDPIHLTRKEILEKFDTWLTAWNDHHLTGVMAWMHNDVVFENWDGGTIKGYNNLYKVWKLWFHDHGNFHFDKEDLIIDEKEQKFVFTWTLTWPSREPMYKGLTEKRKGLDIIHLKEGKIILKQTYSKTFLKIDDNLHLLHLCK